MSNIKLSGRPRTMNKQFYIVCQSFQQNPRKSIIKASLELHIPRSSVHKNTFTPYKFLVVQKFKPNDLILRTAFAMQIFKNAIRILYNNVKSNETFKEP